MSDFKIEKGVSIPTKGRPSKYPFRDMEIDDSFFVPTEDPKVGASITANCWTIAGRKFTVRKVEGGYRCWRVPLEKV